MTINHKTTIYKSKIAQLFENWFGRRDFHSHWGQLLLPDMFVVKFTVRHCLLWAPLWHFSPLK